MVPSGWGHWLPGVTVREAANGRPIPLATVSISGPSGRFSAQTNNSGIANFQNIPQTNYACNVTKQGYKNISSNLGLSTTGTARHTVKLIGAAKGGLNVTVVDAKTRKPIPKARIVANWVTKGNVYKRRKKRGKTVYTSPAGAAILPIGGKSLVTSIFVSAPGYQPVTLKSVQVPGQMEVALNPGNVVKSTPAGKKKISGNLEVKVLDKRTRRPLSGATVAMNINGHAIKMPTRPNGIAYFRGLPAGKYNWTASKPGYRNVQKDLIINGAGTIRQDANLARAN